MYNEFHLDEPWDSEHNSKLIPRMPDRYAMPGVKTKEPGMTHYRAFTGNDALLRGPEPLRYPASGESGAAILFVEAREPVTWTKPDELAYDPAKPLPKLGRSDDTGFLAAFGSMGPEKVRFIAKPTPEKEIKAMIQVQRVFGKP